jgi:hypothetical protein
MANNSDNYNYIAKQEHDKTLRVKKVMNYLSDGSGAAVSDVSPDINLFIDTDSSDVNVQYIGKAAPGTATSAPSWQIKKVDETTGTQITFADGDALFDNIWDNRESLSYS